MNVMPGSAAATWSPTPTFLNSEEQWQLHGVDSPVVQGVLKVEGQAQPQQHSWLDDQHTWIDEQPCLVNKAHKRPAWSDSQHAAPPHEKAKRSIMELCQQRQPQHRAMASKQAAPTEPKARSMMSLSTTRVQQDHRLRPPAGFVACLDKPSPTHVARGQSVKHSVTHCQPQQGVKTAQHMSPVSSPCNVLPQLPTGLSSPLGNTHLNKKHHHVDMLGSECWPDIMSPGLESPLDVRPGLWDATGGSKFKGLSQPQQSISSPLKQSQFHRRQDSPQPLSRLLQGTVPGFEGSDDEDDLAGLLRSQGLASKRGKLQPGTMRPLSGVPTHVCLSPLVCHMKNATDTCRVLSVLHLIPALHVALKASPRLSVPTSSRHVGMVQDCSAGSQQW